MLNIKNAAKEKLEIVKVQDFGSEFLAKPPPPQAAKCVRTTLRIDHQDIFDLRFSILDLIINKS